MDRDEFNELMKRAGLNKKQLAEILETIVGGLMGEVIRIG